MADTYSNTKFTPAWCNAALATGSTTGDVVDTAGYRSNTLVILAGLQSASVTCATPTIYSGSVTGTLTSCAAAELIGTEAAAASGLVGAITDPGVAEAIGYIGVSRYVRADILVDGAATGVFAAVWVQGDAIEPQ